MAHYCLLNKKRKFILCVDPKCGSNTIRYWFFKTTADPEHTRQYIPQYLVKPGQVRSKNDFLRIWFVRNPLHRLVGFYYGMVMRSNKLWCHADEAKRERFEGCTFTEFIRILDAVWKRGDEFQHHLKPQTRAVADIPFDRIVKIEELDSRAEELMDLLGIDVRPDRMNRNLNDDLVLENAAELPPDKLAVYPRCAYESFWSEELTSIARSIYCSDCELYDNL